jgi:hypothetical protein
MRKTLATLLVLGIVLVGYTAWPLYDLFVLLRAIEARDIGTVTQHVYFDRIRASLTNQIITAYLRRTGTEIRPRARQMAADGVLG